MIRIGFLDTSANPVHWRTRRREMVNAASIGSANGETRKEGCLTSGSHDTAITARRHSYVVWSGLWYCIPKSPADWLDTWTFPATLVDQDFTILAGRSWPPDRRLDLISGRSSPLQGPLAALGSIWLALICSFFGRQCCYFFAEWEWE